jgi:hypothetical protein
MLVLVCIPTLWIAHLGADSLDSINEDESAVAEPRSGGHLGREVDVTRGIDEVDPELFQHGIRACLERASQSRNELDEPSEAHRR